MTLQVLLLTSTTTDKYYYNYYYYTYIDNKYAGQQTKEYNIITISYVQEYLIAYSW